MHLRPQSVHGYSLGDTHTRWSVLTTAPDNKHHHATRIKCHTCRPFAIHVNPGYPVDGKKPVERNNKSYRCCHTDCYESHPLFSARHVSIPLGKGRFMARLVNHENLPHQPAQAYPTASTCCWYHVTMPCCQILTSALVLTYPTSG